MTCHPRPTYVSDTNPNGTVIVKTCDAIDPVQGTTPGSCVSGCSDITCVATESLITWLIGDCHLVYETPPDISLWHDSRIAIDSPIHNDISHLAGLAAKAIAADLNGRGVIDLDGGVYPWSLEGDNPFGGATDAELWVVLKYVSGAGDAWEVNKQQVMSHYHPSGISDTFCSAVAQSFVPSVDISAGSGYHVYRVRAGSNLWTAWIDSIQQYQAAHALSLPNPVPYQLWLFGTRIRYAEVRLYKRALTDSEAAQLYCELKARWSFSVLPCATPSPAVPTVIGKSCEPTVTPIPTDEPTVSFLGLTEPPCCDDNDIGRALVRYNGTYCHPGSFDFSAAPQLGKPPCFNPVSGLIEPPAPPIEPPQSGSGDPPLPPVVDPGPGDNPDPTALPSAPVVTSQAATAITTVGATLNSIVNPSSAATNVQYEYGLTTAYGTLTTLTGIGSGAIDVPFPVPIAGLTPNTIYHFRIKATNAGGTTLGGDRSFVTATVPTPPPPTTGLKFSRGMYGGLYRVGKTPMPDVAMTYMAPGFMTALSKCRAAHATMLLNPFGGIAQMTTKVGDPELDPASSWYDVTAVIGGFSIRRWKLSADAMHTALPDPRPWYDDGTLGLIQAFDDFVPGAAALWNGRRPTNNEIDECCRYGKLPSNWVNMPFYIRGPFSAFSSKTNWLYLDGGWLQWSYSANHDPYAYFQSEINIGVRLGLGMMLGGNLLAGGGGPTSPLGWPQKPGGSQYGMSPSEIEDVGNAIAQYASYAFGSAFWATSGSITGGSTAYFDRADIQASFLIVHNQLAGLKRGPINRR